MTSNLRFGRPYWLVSQKGLPANKAERAERQSRTEALRAGGFTKRLRCTTRAQAEALAAEIKAKLGFDMDINEATDLFL